MIKSQKPVSDGLSKLRVLGLPATPDFGTKKLNSMVWVRERTIPTERPPFVGEVIANFCG
jgi:hypothetical protein